jgi:hypothetical protein
MKGPTERFEHHHLGPTTQRDLHGVLHTSAIEQPTLTSTGNQVGDERCTRTVHEHGLRHVDFGHIAFQQWVTNSFLIARISIEFVQSDLQCRVHSGFGVQCHQRLFEIVVRSNHTDH